MKRARPKLRVAMLSLRGWSTFTPALSPTHLPSQAFTIPAVQPLSFLVRKTVQLNKHFLSIFCLLGSLLVPGDIGMVKIMTQVLTRRMTVEPSCV